MAGHDPAFESRFGRVRRELVQLGRARLTHCYSSEIILFMLKALPYSGKEASPQRMESVLAQPAFEGLKAILDRLSADPATLYAAMEAAQNYEDLLAKLGIKLTLTRQIHVNDCYSRLGPAGGIKAVMPYYDIPTQGSMPTLLNFDGTVTTTPKASAFFDAMFKELKTQLRLKS